jgi:Zn-dependent peptidase ImmA (M78 family)
LDDLYAIAAQLNIEVYDLLPRRAGPPVRAALRAVADNLEMVSLGTALEEFVDHAESEVRPERVVWATFDDPVEAAEQLINSLNLKKPSINVEEVAHKCGIPVIIWRFDDDLSGLVAETAGGPVIGVNEGHSPQRQRFTIGHELGHLFLNHLDTFHIDLGSTTEFGNPPGYNWRHERAANEFSAALLMPLKMVELAFRKTPSVGELAEEFDVSEMAMGFRLRNLGLK